MPLSHLETTLYSRTLLPQTQETDMLLYFLSADVPLTKSFALSAQTLVKSPYPHVTYFTSHEESISSLSEFEAALRKHAKEGRCLIKGTLGRVLKHESRAGATTTDAPTQWVCLDIDGLKGFDTPQAVLDFLELGDVSHIVQWSASAGIDTARGMSCHIFFMLEAPVPATILKPWLMHLNLRSKSEVQSTRNTPKGKETTTEYQFLLRDQIALTRTGAALRWPLDITVCQNDKLLYIAPPTLGAGVTCSVKPKDRIKFVSRALPALPTSRLQFNVLSATLEEARALRDELREKAGLKKFREGSLKWQGSYEVQHKPGHAIVTSTKTERNFTYLNLNGGDSWGYYHPEDDASKIFNFKGEPVYLASELIPEYFAAWKERKHTEQASTGIDYFVGCDRRSGAYFKGEFNHNEQRLQMWPARSEKQLQDYLAQCNLPQLDVIPDWTVKFDPHSDIVFDRANLTINQYQMPELLARSLRSKQPPKDETHWPTIKRVIESAVGEAHTPVYEHFMNWLACLVQHRTKQQTAWILHGTQGTGKGVLIEQILAPILGTEYVVRCTQSMLTANFNSILEKALLVFIDEVRVSALNNAHATTEKLKNLITEPVILIEQKYANAYNARSHASFMLASNTADPAVIDRGDRRFNVARYQSSRLVLSDQEFTTLRAELPAFTQYLARRQADKDKARQVVESEDRSQIQSLSQNAGDMVAEALKQGDMGYFLDSMPDPNNTLDPMSPIAMSGTLYTELMTRIMRSHLAGATPTKLTRDELYTIFNYLVGGIPASPNKFTSYLKHRRIHTKKIWVNEKACMGIDVGWTITEDCVRSFNASAPAKKLVAVK